MTSPVTDERGWRQAKDGKWHSPYVEVNGRWVERTDIEWKTKPDRPTPPSNPNEKSLKTKHEDIVKASSNLTDYVDNGLAVEIVMPPHIDSAGLVCVHIRAKFMGNVVDVDDGQFTFSNMPVNGNPVDALKRELANAIRRHNGIEVVQ